MGDSYPDASSVWRALVADTLVMVVITCAMITRLGWWRVVLHERHRARRWVWLVPGLLLVVSLAFVDVGRLREAGAAATLLLLLGTLLIGTGEELMFRGVVLRAMRDRYHELVAAVVTSVAFGLFHLILSPLNAAASTVFGLLLYATRRVSGGIVVPILVHAAWDFCVYSSAMTAERAQAPDGPAVLLVLSIALLVLLVIRRKAIGIPAGTGAWGPQPEAGGGPP